MGIAAKYQRSVSAIADSGADEASADWSLSVGTGIVIGSGLSTGNWIDALGETAKAPMSLAESGASLEGDIEGVRAKGVDQLLPLG